MIRRARVPTVHAAAAAELSLCIVVVTIGRDAAVTNYDRIGVNEYEFKLQCYIMRRHTPGMTTDTGRTKLNGEP